MAQSSGPRALRGLFLVLVLSLLNLLGAFLALTAFGGLGEWSAWQFIGLFGMFEAALGTAYIVAPNIWRLPVAEANTPERTDIRLAPSVVFKPHWAAAAKLVAGLAMLIVAAWHEGIVPASVLVVVVMTMVAAGTIALSLFVARFGVARPDLDVVWFIIRRPQRKDIELQGLSLGGAVVQFLTNITIFPTVKFLTPDLLFRPELDPSFALLLWSTAFGVVSIALALLVWSKRLATRAPVEQEREAEAEFSG
jgi:hypothetical protein